MANGVLTDMDWDEGVQVPVSNMENKALEKQLMQLQANLQLDTGTVDNLDDRIHHMSEHMKNVQQELKHNLALMDAHTKEIETEEHMYMLADREEGRLNQEQIKIKNKLADTREKRNSLENRIFQLNQQLEELKSQINWDQQALEAWLEESARRDEDALTLQKYSTHDDSKLKQLSLQIEKMTEESQKKRMYLDQETTATLTAQMSLDKAADEFREAHNERRQLINQWEKTIEQMQKRDREIDGAAVDLARVKEKIRGKETTIKEKQSFLESETLNNEDMERTIDHEERMAAKLRLDYHDNENMRSQLQNELDTLKFTVERTASDYEAMKSTVNQLKKDVGSKQDRLDYSMRVRGDLENKLKSTSQDMMAAEDRSKFAQQVFEEEEEVMLTLEKKLKETRNNHYKAQLEVQSKMREEKTLSAEIQGSRAANRNMGSRLTKFDHQSIKQQEIVYNQDFTIQQLQRRLARLEGEVNVEEKKELEARLTTMTLLLEDRTASHSLLVNQLKSIRDQNRQVTNSIERIDHEKNLLTSKIEELNLHNEISIKLKKKLIAKKHDHMVDNNILKLEVHRIQEIFNCKADTVLSLEKTNLQMKTAMKERKEEIKVHKQMLFAQIKAAEEERLTVGTELHMRTEKIEKLKKRYEILMVSMSPPPGEEERSAAYYVIKAAQAKEELQRTGDALDAKIRKSEKEIRALENTLRLMNNRNETYRKTFNVVSESSEEYEKKSEMDEQLRSVMDTYKYKRRQIRELQEDLQTMSGAMDTSMRDESAYHEMIQDRVNKIKQLEKDLFDQQGKLGRVGKQLGKSTREVRSKRGQRGSVFEEQDMDVRELRERNKQLTKSLLQVIQQFPDIGDTMDIYFQQADLPPPTRASGSISSLSSARSSRSVSLQSSVRSSTSSSLSISSAKSATRQPVTPKAVDLGLGLNIRPTSQHSRAPSETSSVTSARSVRSNASSRR